MDDSILRNLNYQKKKTTISQLLWNCRTIDYFWQFIRTRFCIILHSIKRGWSKILTVTYKQNMEKGYSQIWWGITWALLIPQYWWELFLYYFIGLMNMNMTNATAWGKAIWVKYLTLKNCCVPYLLPIESVTDIWGFPKLEADWWIVMSCLQSCWTCQMMIKH